MGKRFRKLAKPLVEQTRDLWKRIQQIEDPILRKLKETAYEMLFQPLWDASINEQFYIDYPHLRPKQDVERRKRLKELAEAQMVSLQGAEAGAKGQAKGAAIVKQWDAPLDGDTRDTLRKPDGQIREVDEPFEMDGKEAKYPGDFNDPAEDCHRDFKEKYLKAAEKPANFAKPLKNKEESGIRNGRTIAQRSMSNRLRTSRLHILTESEIESILIDADTLKIPRTVLRFNQKDQTGFYDDEGLIFVRGDILPDVNSIQLRDRLSQRAVLAHEYYGHYLSHPSNFRIGDWRDEFRASYKAAINAPGLSDEERRMLMLDAYDRAKEAGVSVKYNKKARELIHGND